MGPIADSTFAKQIADMDMLKRPVNVGFSGGEKKRMEILQLALQQPKMAVLDETDSGLDIDALRIVAEGVNAMLNPNLGVLLITHYQRLLNHIIPDQVHVLSAGRIVKSGGKELALELEERGGRELLGVRGDPEGQVSRRDTGCPCARAVIGRSPGPGPGRAASAGRPASPRTTRPPA